MLQLAYSDSTANPDLTEEQEEFSRTAISSIYSNVVPIRRSNAAQRLGRVKQALFAAMARGDRHIDVDRLLRVAEGDDLPDLVA